jgi:PAS domain S-box-containing protein
MPNFDGRLFGLLVASVKDYAIFMIDPEGMIMSWNQGAEGIKGYQEAEISGKHISVFYAWQDIENHEPEKNLASALKNGVHEQEGWRYRKDGSRFWADVVFTALYEHGEHIGFAKVTRDITERKQIEDQKTDLNSELEKRVRTNTEKIIADERHFRALIENSHDGICLLDKDLQIPFRSRSAERINGFTNKERDTYGVVDLIHPRDKLIVRELLNQTLLHPGQPMDAEFRTLHRRGRYIWVACRFTYARG